MEIDIFATRRREREINTEVDQERRRQEAKWGVQNHDSVHPAHVNKAYDIADEREAKNRANYLATVGRLTWADIAIEELAEAIEAGGELARRDELIQLAAVVLAWIENIDRNTEQLQEELTR